MFGRSNTKVDAPPVARPRPVAHHGDERMTGYVALCEEVGLRSPAVLRRQVADHLWQHGVEMYAFEEVMAYLRRIKPFGREVVWAPLRARDKVTGWTDTSQGVGWDDTVYDKCVPVDVLRNVKLLHDKFGERVQFQVSVFGHPDPFIMAVTGRGHYVVFGVWDEPTFFRDQGGREP